MILWWIVGIVVLILLAFIIFGSIIEAVENSKNEGKTMKYDYTLRTGLSVPGLRILEDEGWEIIHFFDISSPVDQYGVLKPSISVLGRRPRK